MTVLRTWTGQILTADREVYAAYLEETGLKEYRETPGNLDAWAMYRDLDNGRTEVVTCSRWTSRDAIVAFAGDDISVAVYYPEDDRFLVHRELTVNHYDVVGE